MLVPRGSNVAGQLQLALPPAAKPLAGPAAAGLREFTERRANIFLTRPRVVDARSALLLRPLLADVAEKVGSDPSPPSCPRTPARS
jgi:hypothetical protein